MNQILRYTLATALLAAAAGAHAAAAKAKPRSGNDFPTADRVLYVNECMRDNPGPFYEMVNKCSCAIDAMSREVSYDDYTTMSTVVNGMSIGGERGSEFRDNETIKPQIKRFRDLQDKVKKGCFINSVSK